MKTLREFVRLTLVLMFLLTLVAGAAPGEEVRDLIARVRAAGAQGAGSAEARAARDNLAARGPEVIADLLDGMDTPDTVAANWLRTAFDEVVGRTLRTRRPCLRPNCGDLYWTSNGRAARAGSRSKF